MDRRLVFVGFPGVLFGVAIGLGGCVTRPLVTEPATTGLSITVSASPTLEPTDPAATATPLPAETPASSPPGNTTIRDPKGRFEIELPWTWAAEAREDGSVAAVRGFARLTAVAGAEEGRFRTCLSAAGPWEECGVVQATTLDELERVTAVEPLVVQGIGAPLVTTEATTIDGEPAIIVRIEAFEHPARGGQWLAYVLVIHEGRPYFIRIRNPMTKSLWLDDVRGGFRFLD